MLIIFAFINFIIITLQVTVSVKRFYKTSFLITILYTIATIVLTPYIKLIIICYITCFQFWALSFACYFTRYRLKFDTPKNEV